MKSRVQGFRVWRLRAVGFHSMLGSAPVPMAACCGAYKLEPCVESVSELRILGELRMCFQY